MEPQQTPNINAVAGGSGPAAGFPCVNVERPHLEALRYSTSLTFSGSSRAAGPSSSFDELAMPAVHSSASAKAQPAAASRALFVGGLHPSVSDVMLHGVFSSLGPVEEIKIIRGRLSNLSAGYGFVTYRDRRYGPRQHPRPLQETKGVLLWHITLLTVYL